MSKRAFRAGVAILALALAFLATDRLCWSPGLTKANLRRVRVGMTLEEVKAVLGDWPALMGREGQAAFWVQRVTAGELASAGGPGGGPVWVNWYDGKGCAVAVCFHGGRVRQPAAWVGTAQDAPGPFARLRAWLGW